MRRYRRGLFIIVLLLLFFMLVGGVVFYYYPHIQEFLKPVPKQSRDVVLDPNRPMLRDRYASSTIYKGNPPRGGAWYPTQTTPTNPWYPGNVPTTPTNQNNNNTSNNNTNNNTNNNNNNNNNNQNQNNNNNNNNDNDPPSNPNENHAPVFASIPPKTVSTNAPLTFTVLATDSDADSLTYSTNLLPPGATFNASTRVFSWTPQYAGIYYVIFRVTDGTAVVTTTVQIKVVTGTTGPVDQNNNNQNQNNNNTSTLGNPTDSGDPADPQNPTNNAPVFAAISNKNIFVNNNLTFTVSATDADGNNLVYSTNPLPSGATFNASTRTFSWTPTSSQTGPHVVTFKVSDGIVTVTKSIYINVYANIVNPTHAASQVSYQTPPSTNPNEPSEPGLPAQFAVFDAVEGYASSNPEPDPLIPGLPVMWVGGYMPYFFNDYHPVTNKYPSHPHKETVEDYAESLPEYAKVTIDIEHWPIDISYRDINTGNLVFTPAQVQATIQKFQNIISWMRAVRPDLEIGIYGMVPVGDYWRVVYYHMGVRAMNSLNAGDTSASVWAASGVASQTGPNGTWVIDPTKDWTKWYNEWKGANDFLAPLAQSVDFIAPSVYPPYVEDIVGQGQWNNSVLLMTRELITEAQQYGKPVYPYVWFRIDDIEAGKPLIPVHLFRQQLDVIKNSGAEGLIMWDWGYGAPWNPPLPWYNELKDFVQDNNLVSNTTGMKAATYDAIPKYDKEFWAYAWITLIALLALSRALYLLRRK